MKLNKRIKYLHIRIKNGVRQTHTAYRELSESEVKRVPNRYWVDDLPKPMKRIKKERTHNIEDTHYACNEQMERLGADTPCCICFGHKCKKPKPMKRIKKECKHDEHHATTKDGEHWCPVCREVLFSSPKPTKIEKLVIKEDWSETTFEQQKDRLHVHMRYFEDDDNGGKWEGGSSSFSVPLKKLKDYLLSH